MDLTFRDQTEYILEVRTRYAADDHAALALTDERHPRGLGRRQVEKAPLLPNGKMNRRALPKPDAKSADRWHL